MDDSPPQSGESNVTFAAAAALTTSGEARHSNGSSNSGAEPRTPTRRVRPREEKAIIGELAPPEVPHDSEGCRPRAVEDAGQPVSQPRQQSFFPAGSHHEGGRPASISLIGATTYRAAEGQPGAPGGGRSLVADEGTARRLHAYVRNAEADRRRPRSELDDGARMLSEAQGRLAHAQGDTAKVSRDAAINCGRGLITEMEAEAAVEAMHRQGLEAVAREIGQRDLDANRDAVRDDARRGVSELNAYLQAEMTWETMADSRRLEEAVARQRNQAERLSSEYQRLEAANRSAEEKVWAKEAEVRNEGQQCDDAWKRLKEGRSEL